MVDNQDTQDPRPTFDVAWAHLSRAGTAHARLADLWSTILSAGPFSSWSETPEPRIWEAWCSFDPDPELFQHACDVAANFLLEVRAALDEAVAAAADAACRDLGGVDPALHRMPLCARPSEFDALTGNGLLQGLRPDQMRLLRRVQPFQLRLGDETTRQTALGMTHLAAALDQITGAKTAGLLTAWASEATLATDPASGGGTVELTNDPPGTLAQPKRLARAVLRGVTSEDPFTGDTGVYFDPILNAAPWPEHPDDTLGNRSKTLMESTAHIIEQLEASIEQPSTAELLRALEHSIPETDQEVWRPIDFAGGPMEAEVRAALSEPEATFVSYMTDDGVLVYVRLGETGEVLGREFRAAVDLYEDNGEGPAVEKATRAAAGRWGLPDFVLEPKVFAKGSGIRELGDGTILSGRRGIALQVKSRAVTGDSPERAAKWMLRNAAHGLRQARGTIRTALVNPAVELTNLRGRTVAVRGDCVDWVPVVVIDHPSPPATGVVPPSDPKGPSVVVLRRDWEFLWSHLRSASAVVDYMHRVAAEEPIELGSETNRYLNLVAADDASTSEPPPEWLASAKGTHVRWPMLPDASAPAADPLGYEVFHSILEEIARTDFTGSEADRLTVLAQIDRVPVAARAELGRLLLRRLIECAEAPTDEHMMSHRRIYLDGGFLELTFTTMTQLTGHHQRAFHAWTQVRRQEFMTALGARGPIWPWSVNVLLTPRADHAGLWDTTVVATNGPSTLDAHEYARLAKVFPPPGQGPQSQLG